MLRLSAFADEIAPQLAEQIRVCRECGITHFELRTVEGINVLDFDSTLRHEIRSQLHDNGLGVQTIASPIGKVKISDPWPAHFDRFKIAVETAEFFEAPFIRLFSYYPPSPGESMLRHRDEVLRRMRAKIDYLDGHPVVLVHENEKDIYGERGRECLDLLASIDSPKLRCAFDSANFVQAGEKPLDNWLLLKPYTVQIHVKDAKLSDGTVVLAGTGDGDYPAILADAYASGYRGFLSLEPHLAVAGQFSGFSGPTLFSEDTAALKAMCAKLRIPLDDPGWRGAQ
jgi:sugar phosphate isomerase/epimerase